MAKRKIKGTTITGGGKRKIYVFIEKSQNSKRKRFYKTELTDLQTVKDINARRREMRAELLSEVFPENINSSNNLTFSQYLDKWLEEVCRPRLASRTFEDYCRYTKNFIVPFLKLKGDFLLTDLSPVKIHDLFIFLEKRGKAWAIDKMKRILSSACSNAVNWNLIEFNPVKRVRTETRATKDRKILSVEDTRKLLNFCDSTHYGLAIETALLTGLRPGELSALRWSDIDFKNGFLQVRQSVAHLRGGGFEFKKPKSRSGIRRIAIAPFLVQKLRDHQTDQKRMIEYRTKKSLRFENLDLIFATRFGTPVMSGNLNKRDLKSILEKAGLSSEFSLYSLRHSIASLLLADGANVKDVQNMLGHSQASFTMNRYVHSLPDAQKELSQRFVNIFESEVIETKSVN